MALVKDLIDEMVQAEREKQDARFGVQNHPDGTHPLYEQHRELSRYLCDTATKHKEVTWRHILEEEFWEALAETDPTNLKAELIQVMAVAKAWIECINRRQDAGKV